MILVAKGRSFVDRAKAIGLDTRSVIVRKYSNKDADILVVDYNIHRDDMAKVAGSDSADAADVATMGTDRISRRKNVFSGMSVVSCSVDTIGHPGSNLNGGTGDSWIEKNLMISIAAQSADDMKAAYKFTEEQDFAVNKLLE